MNFTVEKTENCFADAQTYAYKAPQAITEAVLALPAFAAWGICEIKRNYRRPFYFIRGNGMEIKGILGDTCFKVSYPEADWQQRKIEFEKALEEMPCA